MRDTDRSAAHALKAAERPDVRALRSALSRVERNFDNVLALQDTEIRRLRRLVMRTARAYRETAESARRPGAAKTAAFSRALDDLCLEADAILFAESVEAERKRG